MLKKIIYAIGAIALLIGLWGFYERLMFGEKFVSYGSDVVWGLWVAMYFLFGGIAIGSFFIASLEYLFGIEAFKDFGKPALWTSLVTLVVAMMSIGFDLGHMERIWKAFLQPNFHSGVVEDVWGYTIFGILTLIALILAIRQSKGSGLKIVMALGFILSLYVAGSPGKLLANNATRLYWHAALLPMQFVFMALLSGVAMTLVIQAFVSLKEGTKQATSILSLASVVLLVISLYFVWAYFSQSLYGNIPSLTAPINELVSGQYALLFWGVQIVIGSIIPLLVLVQPKLAHNQLFAGVMGLFILVGNAVARYLIIVPGLNVSVMNNVETAFQGPGLTLNYSPSPVEWAVVSGALGIVILGILIGVDYLPLYSKKSEA
jgi:molybdopterin-containing oxidoreductase family membrane subunit